MTRQFQKNEFSLPVYGRDVPYKRVTDAIACEGKGGYMSLFSLYEVNVIVA